VENRKSAGKPHSGRAGTAPLQPGAAIICPESVHRARSIMSDYTPIIVFAVVILIFVGIQMYNSFIKYRNQIEEEWSGIDVALKRRYNLIPNLVRAVRSYAKHELDTMESVTEKRVETGGPGHLDARQAEESKVSRALNEVLAVAEAYPDLKASTNYLALQQSLGEVEAEILHARRRYNSSVRKYNTQVESFPSNLMAKLFGFEKTTYFTLELATQRDLPEIAI
jgi:LemA protein